MPVLNRRDFLRGAAFAAAAPMINRGRFAPFPWSRAAYSARCVDLMQRALVIDMLSPLTINSVVGAKWNARPESFGPADFGRFKSSGIHSFHTAVGFGGPDAYQTGLQYFLGGNALIAGRSEYFARIDSAGDFDATKAAGKVGVILGAQNSEHFVTPSAVAEFYGFGQRVSQLTYNSRNFIGNGSTERRDEGLSDYGVEIVAKMNEVGMAVDVSHCGDRTSLDAFEVSKKPALVTHSNARALVPGHPRCKPDEVVRALGRAGSVMGITGVRNFVKATEPTTVEDYLDHIDYVARLIGVEHVGIGSDIDLDGYDDLPPDQWQRLKSIQKPSYGFREKMDIDEIAHPKRMFDVTEGLIRRKYGDDQILGILGGNFKRVFAAIWV